nr:MAG TPA: hypothetical protein [Caudoviricetes sp.]
MGWNAMCSSSRHVAGLLFKSRERAKILRE